MKIFLIFIITCMALLAKTSNTLNLWEQIKLDHKNYYLESDYQEAGFIFLTGGIMANSNIDESIRKFYQTKVRNNDDYGSHEIDEQSAIDKLFGEGKIMIPIALASGLIGSLTNNETIQQWGEGVSRAYLVGFPPMLMTQLLTGGSRPAELSSDDTSAWEPFKDKNGVSGHSFMGSIPFLVAANMSETKFMKYFFYGASALTGLSRINDDAHFASQALLGWYMGYMAVESINKTEKSDKKLSLTLLPIADKNSAGIYFSFNK